MIFTLHTPADPNLDLILPFWKGELDVQKISEITGVSDPDFEGGFSEYSTLYGDNGQRIYLLGLGEEKHKPRIQEAFQKFAFKTGKNWKGSIQLDCGILTEREVMLAVLGFELATYKIGVFKSEEKEKEKEKYKSFQQSRVLLICDKEISTALEEGRAIGETVNRIKALVDAPSNIKTPVYLAEWAATSAKSFNYNCNVLDRKKLVEEGFGALLAVGDGSRHEPRLIVISYFSNNDGKIDLGIVGKGITFDSGGLSIKPSQNLHYMKSDMGGAAAVLGTIELAAKLKLNVNVVGVVAAAENAVDANSFKPGDVIKSYSGKTIEIIDTDAEGRLVLADALTYMIKQYNPDRILDLATLTGSVVRTLGYSAAGIFTKNEEMARDLSLIGNSVYERVWQLPLYDDFEEDLHSDIADIRNFSNKPVAGAISAAKFLEAFTESHEKWAHIDIAGVAFGSSDYSKMHSATGYGVRLIIEYLKSISK